MKNGIDAGFYPAAVDRATVREDFAAEGFSFGVMADPQGRRWEDFAHPTDEYVVVVEGELEFEIAGETATARPGDRARIAAGSKHSVRTLSEGGSIWLYGYGPKGAGDG